MADIIHWKDIATKHYGDIDEFERITKDLIFCARTEKNPKEAFKGITLEKQAAYDKTRYLMRHAGYEQTGKHIITEHGWYTAYLDGEGLAFKCTIPQETRKLITLAQYIEWQQNNSLEDAAEEYYETRGIVNSVASGMSERHTRKDIYDDEGALYDQRRHRIDIFRALSHCANNIIADMEDITAYENPTKSKEIG